MSRTRWIHSLQPLKVKGQQNWQSWRGPAAQASDVAFLSSWLAYDSTYVFHMRNTKLNWHFLAGLLLAAAVSAGVWAGIGLAVARWR